MLAQGRLDLRRVAVEAADDEHVLEPAGDAQVALLVQAADVAGVQPALLIKGAAGGLGVAEIALHQVEATQADLAVVPRGYRLALRVEDRQLGTGNRPAAGAGDDLG